MQHVGDMAKPDDGVDVRASLLPTSAAATAAAVSFASGRPFMSRDKRKRFTQLLVGGIVAVAVLLALTAVAIAGVVVTLRDMRVGAQLATPIDSYTGLLQTLQRELDDYLPLQLPSTVLAVGGGGGGGANRMTQARDASGTDAHDDTRIPRLADAHVGTRQRDAVTLSRAADDTNAALRAFVDAVALPDDEAQEMQSALTTLRVMATSTTTTIGDDNTAHDADVGDAFTAYLQLVNVATAAVLQRVRDGATEWFGQTLDIMLTDVHTTNTHTLASFVAALHTVKRSNSSNSKGDALLQGATSKAVRDDANVSHNVIGTARADDGERDAAADSSSRLSPDEAEMLAWQVDALAASLSLDQQAKQVALLQQQEEQQQQQQEQQRLSSHRIVDADAHRVMVQRMMAVLRNATALRRDTVDFAVPATPEQQRLPYKDTGDLATLAQTLTPYNARRVVVDVQPTVYQLICFSVACLLLGLTLVANALLLRRHWRQLQPIRRLIAAFEDAKATAARRLRYLAVLQELRAVALPRAASSVTEREYLVAAHFLDTLRVAVPQLLYGHPHSVMAALGSRRVGSHSGNTTGGGGNGSASSSSSAAAAAASSSLLPPQSNNVVLSSKVRLESGRWHCPATVLMEVALTGMPTIAAADALSCGVCNTSSSNNVATAAAATATTTTTRDNGNHTRPRHVADTPGSALSSHLALLSAAYSIIVDEVNDAGGVVLGMYDGLHVLAVWNATAPARHAALAATRVGSVLHARLRSALPELTTLSVSVTCGHAVLSNGPLASRMASVLTSTAFANVLKLRTVHSSLRVPLLLDGDTHRALPFRAREACKPVVLMRSASVAETLSMVVYVMDVCSSSNSCNNNNNSNHMAAADASAQRALYDAGFFLYQNNMIAQAVEQLQRYVHMYPHDTTAQWLLTHILLPRQLAVAKSTTTSAAATIDDDDDDNPSTAATVTRMQAEALRVFECVAAVQAQAQRCLSRRQARQPPPSCAVAQAHVTLVLDVFDVLDVAPRVGALLLCGPHAHAQRLFADAMAVWWWQQQQQQQQPYTTPTWQTQQHTPHALRVRLVLVRVPRLYLCLATCSDDDDKDTRSSDGDAVATKRQRCCAAAMCVCADGATHVHVMGVVHAVYYASRHATRPLPLVRMRLLLTHAHTSCALHEDACVQQPQQQQQQHLLQPLCLCRVDLRLLPPRVQRRVAVVGQVVELRGRRVLTYRTPATTAASRALPAVVLREHVQAYHAHVTLSTSTLRDSVACMTSTRAQAQQQQQQHDSSSSNSGEKNSGDDNSARHTTTLRVTADDVETAAARHAVHCWCGVRLALGVDDATAQTTRAAAAAAATSRDDNSGAVVCNDVFALSLDAIVALLVTLFSAQLPASSAVSLLLVDECVGASTMLCAARRLWSRGCLACVDADLADALPGNHVAWLPHYTAARRAQQQQQQQQHKRPRSQPLTAAAATATTPAAARRACAHDSRRRGRRCGTLRGDDDDDGDDDCVNDDGEDVCSDDAGAAVSSCSRGEVVSAGVLSMASRRTLLVRRVEALSRRALTVLQAVLGAAVPSTRTTTTVTCRAHDSDDNGDDDSDNDDDDAWCVVQREGGQKVTCLATRSVVLTLERACALPSRPALFELAQRMHIVLRPSYNAARGCAAAVYATHTSHVTTTAAAAAHDATTRAQTLLWRRANVQWLPLLCRALALPREASQWSPPPPHASSSYAMPSLSPSCSALLHAYVLAAKAVATSAVDASLIDTLVRLTHAHAAMRTRIVAVASTSPHTCRDVDVCCHCSSSRHHADDGGDGGMAAAAALGAAVLPHMFASCASPSSLSRNSDDNDEDDEAMPTTMLIDAVVAIGLCDATLHLFSDKTLLGQCVFALLERVMLRTACSCNDDNSDNNVNNSDDAAAVFVHDMAVTTRPWPACLMCASSSSSSSFTMRAFVDELTSRLQDLACTHDIDKAS